MEERIKSIYNECWKIYKQYLETRDMAEWNRNMLQVKEKYGGNRNYNKQHGKKHNKGNISYYPNGNR